MNKIFLKQQLIAILSLFIFLGCATTSTTDNKVDSETGEGKEQVLFKEYKKNRPDKKAASIGELKADQIFHSIAKIYNTTAFEILDKYIARIENSKVMLIGEEIRQKDGQEAYNNYIANLTSKDKIEYEKFVKNEIDTLSVVQSYLTEALRLQQSISKLNVTVYNPFKLVSVAKSTKLAKNQIAFTIKSLQWLNKNRKTYNAYLTYAGR